MAYTNAKKAVVSEEIMTETNYTNKVVNNSDKIDGYHISVVTSIPSTPDASTIYILK